MSPLDQRLDRMAAKLRELDRQIDAIAARQPRAPTYNIDDHFAPLPDEPWPDPFPAPVYRPMARPMVMMLNSDDYAEVPNPDDVAPQPVRPAQQQAGDSDYADCSHYDKLGY
jgi:hypothetical protein